MVEISKGAHAEDALVRHAPTDAADRAHAWHLVLGALRLRSAADWVIEAAAGRPLRALDPEVLAVLRLAVVELRTGRAPEYAVVHDWVESTRALGVAHARGLVNAVLRNQAKHEPPSDAKLGHPDWLVRRWRTRWGADADARMRASNRPAENFIACREDPAGVARAFQHAGLSLTPVAPLGTDSKTGRSLGENTFRLPPGPVTEMPGFAEGRWWVMDPAFAAIADLCGDVEGKRVLDACAAPGGKAFRLCSRGAIVAAVDVDAGRLAKVTEGAARLGMSIETAVHDWTAGPIAGGGEFDVVLVDAPCTALGVLRRHPDARWTRRESDIASMAEKQRRIVAGASQHVAPGGALVYAVCSPEPEEGSEVLSSLGWEVEAVFDNAPGVEGEDLAWGGRGRRPIGADIPGVARASYRHRPGEQECA
jgi:16S rRNA (cytosine967-C5)-methyltransferase